MVDLSSVGGIVSIPLMFVSVLSLAIIIERIIFWNSVLSKQEGIRSNILSMHSDNVKIISNNKKGDHPLIVFYNSLIQSKYDGFQEFTTEGGKPTSHYIPRFRNVYKQETDFLRGYAAGFGARPMRETNRNGFGDKLKSNLLETKENGMWSINAHMMGETIPKETNQVSIDKEKKDSWGIPQINIDVDYDANDEKMINDFFEQFTEMFTKAGFKNIKINDNHRRPGNDIHEMGGVRMGKDPKTSLLNKWNQLHQCKNVFVSDGACMTSTSTQNPSLTFMAISARAANYAINEIKKGNL